MSIWEANEMLCDNCSKNEATIHYTEVINGVKSERHLCNDCMQEMNTGMEGEFPFSKLIQGILSSHLANSISESNPMNMVKCNKCQMTYEDFTKTGKFGCSECYSVFGPLILDNIKKIQGSSTHNGKKYNSEDVIINENDNPKNAKEDKMSVLARLNELKKKAVDSEDYIEAARLRDEIKKTREGMK